MPPNFTTEIVLPPLPSAGTESAERVGRKLLDAISEALHPPDVKALSGRFDQLRQTLGMTGDSLTRRDIDLAIGDARVSGDQALALIALKQHFFDDTKRQKISRKEIEAVTTGGDLLKIAALAGTMNDARATIAGAKRTLYADEANPKASIDHKAVVQAGIGNCYFFAALASLADCSPQSVVDMIKKQKDGSYSVTFPGSKSVRVTAPTDAELVLFPKPTDQGTWVHVLEKAYGTQCMEDSLYLALRKLRGMEDTPIPQCHTDGGSAMDAGLRVLTNKSIGWSWSFKGPKSLHDDLVDAFNRQAPVTADTGFSAKVEGGPATQHVYSVLKYDAAKQILTIRNPWASGVPSLKGIVDKGDGVFETPLDVFAAYFSKISYSKR